MAMSKIDFVKKAPTYYAVAICAALVSTSARPMRTRDDIDSYWDKETYVLKQDAVWDAAVGLLLEDGVIEVVKDDFGPDLSASTLRPAPLIGSTRSRRQSTMRLQNSKTQAVLG
jgi:hypothetical protein